MVWEYVEIDEWPDSNAWANTDDEDEWGECPDERLTVGCKNLEDNEWCSEYEEDCEACDIYGSIKECTYWQEPQGVDLFS